MPEYAYIAGTLITDTVAEMQVFYVVEREEMVHRLKK